jgi:hypothetical protein
MVCKKFYWCFKMSLLGTNWRISKSLKIAERTCSSEMAFAFCSETWNCCCCSQINLLELYQRIDLCFLVLNNVHPLQHRYAHAGTTLPSFWKTNLKSSSVSCAHIATYRMKLLICVAAFDDEHRESLHDEFINCCHLIQISSDCF